MLPSLRSAAQEAADIAPVGDAAAPFLQLYTSGTTGVPKGVPQTHLNHMAAYRAWADSGIGQWAPGDVCLIALPVFHAIGANFTLFTLLQGGAVYLLREFSPDSALKALDQGGVTRMPLVPTLIDMLSRDERVQALDHGRLQSIIYGGSGVSLPTLQRGMTVFGCQFTQVYAATETTAAAVSLSPDDHLGENPPLRAAGRVQKGLELKVVNERGEEAATGEVGEIAPAGRLHHGRLLASPRRDGQGAPRRLVHDRRRRLRGRDGPGHRGRSHPRHDDQRRRERLSRQRSRRRFWSTRTFRRRRCSACPTPAGAAGSRRRPFCVLG